MLRKNGVTRVSIGIQSFDFESLRDTARTFTGHKRDDEERAVKLLMDSGIPHINIDMIQDLPVQGSKNLERLEKDLRKVKNVKPNNVSWYNLRLRPETAYARRTLNLVDENESLLTRLTIWNAMERIGYTVLEGDRFALTARYEDTFRKARGSVDSDLLGIGVSAYSHVYPAFFQNARVIGGRVRADSKRATQEYIRQVNEEGYAITHGFKLSDDELLAGKFALGLKKGVSLTELHEYLAFSPDCGAYNRVVLEPSTRFIEAGLLEVDEGQIRFTRKGRLFENEICAQFYSPRTVYNAHERRGTLTPEIMDRYRQYRETQVLSQVMAEQKVA